MADTAQRHRILALSAGTAGASRFLSGVLPHAARAHARRCRTLGPPSEAEVERLSAEFRARGSTATLCPPAHALPVQNGASLDAENWTV
jgi:hypothetical protein